MDEIQFQEWQTSLKFIGWNIEWFWVCLDFANPESTADPPPSSVLFFNQSWTIPVKYDLVCSNKLSLLVTGPETRQKTCKELQHWKVKCKLNLGVSFWSRIDQKNLASTFYPLQSIFLKQGGSSEPTGCFKPNSSFFSVRKLKSKSYANPELSYLSPFVSR